MRYFRSYNFPNRLFLEQIYNFCVEFASNQGLFLFMGVLFQTFYSILHTGTHGVVSVGNI